MTRRTPRRSIRRECARIPGDCGTCPGMPLPERDSPAPTRMTARVRGSLMFHTTVSIAARQVCSIGMTGDSKILMTVTGSMSYRPLNSDMIKMTNSSRHSATSIEIFFSTFFISQPCRGLYAVYLHWLTYQAPSPFRDR